MPDQDEPAPDPAGDLGADDPAEATDVAEMGLATARLERALERIARAAQPVQPMTIPAHPSMAHPETARAIAARLEALITQLRAALDGA